MFQNCRRAMSAQSRLIIVEPMIPGPEEPHLSKLLDLEMLTLPGGIERTEAEYRDLLQAGGFRLARIVPTRSSTSVVEGIAA